LARSWQLDRRNLSSTSRPLAATSGDKRPATSGWHLNRRVRTIPGIEITQKVEASAVFATLPRAVSERLQERFHFYFWNHSPEEVRWMTSWATSPEDVDEFLAALRAGMSAVTS